MRQAVLGVAMATLLVLSALGASPAAGAAQDTETVIELQLHQNGDARWSIETRFNLTNQNRTAAFERLRAEFESGSGSSSRSVEVFREAAARVSERTGREMAITAVERTSSVETKNDSRVGVLTLSFTWTNFAHTVDDRGIVVGDAFESGWFGDLGPSQTLIVDPPSGYQVHTARPSTDIVGGALRWEGPQSFEPGQPSIEFRPAATPTSPPPTQPPQGIPWTYAVVGFGGVVIAGLVLLAWRGGYFGGLSSTEGDGNGPSSGAETAETEATAPSEAGQAETAPDAEPEATDEEPDEIDTELLSDEERVEHLLQEYGGRMKQAKIVEETRWSNAKVSQLLSSMAEEGRVEKLRIGRENLISLPDYDEEGP